MCPDFVVYMVKLESLITILKKSGSSNIKNEAVLEKDLHSLIASPISSSPPIVLRCTCHVRPSHSYYFKYSSLGQFKRKHNGIFKCAERLHRTQYLENKKFKPKYGQELVLEEYLRLLCI